MQSQIALASIAYPSHHFFHSHKIGDRLLAVQVRPAGTHQGHEVHQWFWLEASLLSKVEMVSNVVICVVNEKYLQYSQKPSHPRFFC